MILYASELAACIGRNKYESVDEAKLKVYRRVFRKSFEAAEKRTGIRIRTLDEKVLELPVELTAVAQCPHERVTEKLNEILAKPALSVTDTKSEEITAALSVSTSDAMKLFPKMTDSMETQVSQTLCAAVKAKEENDLESMKSLIGQAMALPLVKDCVTEAEMKQVVNKKRGCEGEEKATDEYETKFNTTVGRRNDQFYSCWISDDVMIGGRCDGLTENGTKIVEIKCRQNRIFRFLPDYEHVQILAYMAMTGASCCDLVQKYKNRIEVTTYAFDQYEWEEIKIAALEFVADLLTLTENVEMQNELLLKCNHYN